MIEILEVGVNEIMQDPFAQYEIHSYLPYINSFKNHEVIRISVHHQEQYLVPSGSSLHIQGKFTKVDGQNVVDDTNLVTNVIHHLFSEIQYDLNSIAIDRCKNVGITSLMNEYPTLTKRHSKTFQLSGWECDEIMDENGNFDVLIVQSTIFGFARDFQKIVCNAKHELILTRSKTDINAIIQTAAAAGAADNDYIFSIKKIAWMMPYLVPSDYHKAKLL